MAFNVWGFATGVLIVGVYAAIRPRLGAGPKTAICAGLIIWATAYVLGSAAPVFLHLFPVGLMAIGLAVGFVETMVAGLAGAYFYKENAVEVPRASAMRA
jgi:dipeptide/tripeptide permease